MAADYAMTAELLAAHGVTRSVSEIHGVLCGQLCADSSAYELGLSLKILDLDIAEDDVIANLIKMLAEDILSQFQSENYAFQLLLPDEESEFGQRLTALSLWCDGFNAGFAGAWIKDDGAMTAETREVLSDFSRVAEIEQADEEAGENENEVNFMEIEEYVRMAAMTLYLQGSIVQAESVALNINVADGNVH